MTNIIEWCNANSGFFSAVVSLLSFIVSIIAVIVAIMVPKRIARKQNQIATFKKRMDCYNQILKYVIESEHDYVAADNLISPVKMRRRIGVIEQADLMTRSRLLFPEKLSKRIDDLLLSYNTVNSLDINLDNSLNSLNDENRQQLNELLCDDNYLKMGDEGTKKLKDILSNKTFFSIEEHVVEKTVFDLLIYEKALILSNEKSAKELLKDLEKEIALHKIKQF